TASGTGSAVKLAGLALRGKLVELALADSQSPLAGLAANALDAGDGALFDRSNPGRRDAIVEIVKRSGKSEVVAEHKTDPKKEREQYSIHAFGAQFAEVKVDALTGEVRVTRCVGAFGC